MKTILKACLNELRFRVIGKAFAECPELWKDIESLKAKIRSLG